VRYRGRLLVAASCVWLMLHGPADLQAQQARTLAGGNPSYGGFGALVLKGSAVNDQFAGFFGARGGWLVSHQFGMGAGGYVLAGGVDVERPGSGPQSLDMWYAGAEFEFISVWSQVYHMTVLGLIGGGSLGLGGESDGIWVLEPALNLEFNVASWFRLDFGGGYRFVWDVDLAGLDTGDLSQFFGQVSMKFGAF
jgi:hypothetical protein